MTPETKLRAVEAMIAVGDLMTGDDDKQRDEVAQILNAALAVIEAEAWRPIETAPREMRKGPFAT